MAQQRNNPSTNCDRVIVKNQGGSKSTEIELDPNFTFKAGSSVHGSVKNKPPDPPDSNAHDESDVAPGTSTRCTEGRMTVEPVAVLQQQGTKGDVMVTEEASHEENEKECSSDSQHLQQ